MEYRELGRTGIRVSALCLGTLTWGEQNTEADGHAQMDMAVDRGINFFDTAETYAVPTRAETQGRTEEIIGSWFKARGGRDRIILASKFARSRPGPDGVAVRHHEALGHVEHPWRDHARSASDEPGQRQRGQDSRSYQGDRGDSRTPSQSLPVRPASRRRPT